MGCAVCGGELPEVHGAGRPRLYCSTACRQRAYRGRHEGTSGAASSSETRRAAEPGITVIFIPAPHDPEGSPGIDSPLDLIRLLVDALREHGEILVTGMMTRIVSQREHRE